MEEHIAPLYKPEGSGSDDWPLGPEHESLDWERMFPDLHNAPEILGSK